MYPIKSDKVSITSRFGNRTYKYQGKTVKDFHRGIDLVANPNNKNEEILAYEDGVVTSLRKQGKQYGDGCYVRIKHSNGFYTLYFHMKTDSICVNVGDKVKKGQKIGVIGKTGIATGTHLHFQIDRGSNSSAVDPYDYLFNGKKLIEEVNDMKFSVGDEVIVSGSLYASSNATTPSGSVKDKKTVITRVAQGTVHPYNTTGDLGWMNEADIELVEKEIDTNDYKSLYEEEVKKNKALQTKIDNAIKDLQ